LRDRSSYQPAGTSANATDYAKTFLRRAHNLVGRGYANLIPAQFACAEEETITGELVQAVETVLDDARAPRWMRWFSIHEDPRVQDPARQGKRRLKLDIRIDSSQNWPRARLHFEAKRLGSNHGISVYLGSEGIQRFLEGRYAHDDPFAGMLGYVQQGQPDEWGTRIKQHMKSHAKNLCLRPSGCWHREKLLPGPSATYRSAHDRPTVGKPIEIFHTLLLFN